MSDLRNVSIKECTDYLAHRHDLALRAKTWDQLFDPVLPGIFLAWAKRTDIPVPPELTEAVEKRGVQVADWKSLHGEAVEARKRDAEAAAKRSAEWKRLLDESLEQLGKQRADWLEVVADRNAKIATLEVNIEALRSEQPALKTEAGLGARERDSLLKLIIGMAVAGYVYHPKATRSDKPAEIAGDLARASHSTLILSANGYVKRRNFFRRSETASPPPL
jgi:hypothetical protein